METVEFVDYTTGAEYFSEGRNNFKVCLLKSNGAQVEIRSGNGNLYRLGSNSELSLEYTRLKVCNLYFTVGFYMHLKIIFYTRKKWWADQNDQVYRPGGKYRTSCYMFNFGNGMAVTDCLSTNEDVYYTLSGSLSI